jgi:hypothetical protein
MHEIFRFHNPRIHTYILDYLHGFGGVYSCSLYQENECSLVGEANSLVKRPENYVIVKLTLVLYCHPITAS